jgi:DNA (cytosine-5)-methyltransferase 1
MLRDQGYIRVKEAAKLLGVCPNTVRAWGASGKIPEHRHPVNNYRLYRRSELEKLLARMGAAPDKDRKS